MDRGPRAIHPLFLAAYPVLVLYSFNAAEVPFRVVVGPLAISLGATLATWGALGALLRDRRKAALLTSLLLALFFGYGYAYEWAAPHAAVRHRTLLPLWALAAAAGAAGIVRLRQEPRGLHRLLNVGSGALVAAAVWSVAAFDVRRALEASSFAPESVPAPAIPTGAVAELPDIYYIIVDSYASNRTLRDSYGFDNSSFVRRLEALGFYVAPESRANYPTTLPSMSSALNMEYLDRLMTLGRDDADNTRAFHRLLRENRVSRELAQRGYTPVLIHPPWEILTGDFSFTLWQLTALRYWRSMDHYHERTLSAFDRIAKVAERPEPTFVYAHILCPHPPYIFGPRGERINPAAGSFTTDPARLRRLYLDQLQFVNLRLDALLDTILARPGVKPIIVLQSDHGPAIADADIVNDPSPRAVQERLRNFSAFLVPDSVRAHLYPSISPVNVFRAILTYRFGADYPRLADESFWYTPKRPTTLVKVPTG